MTGRKKAKAANDAKPRISLDEARAVIMAHSEAENEKRRAEMLPMVGLYFRTTNAYGPGDKWWLYARVTRVDALGWPHGWSFEKTSDDEVLVKPDQPVHIKSGGWREISAAEFWGQAARIRSEVVDMLSRGVD